MHCWRHLSERAALFIQATKNEKQCRKIYQSYTNSSKFEAQMIEPTVLHSIKNLQPGAITQPVLTYDETGMQVYKIFKLISVTPEHKATLLDDYQTIKEMALQEKKQKAISQWISNKQESTYISLPDSKYSTCVFKHVWKNK